jgi:hypothetical protein
VGSFNNALRDSDLLFNKSKRVAHYVAFYNLSNYVYS